MMNFRIIALNPSGLIDPSIPIAASRAGGLGVLDLEFIKDEGDAYPAIDKLAQYTQTSGGIKIGMVSQNFFKKLLSNLPELINVVILTANEPHRLSNQVASLHKKKIQVLFEVSSVDKARAATEANADGLIAKGNEAGGWIGGETTFILLQRLLNSVSLPVWAHGGIGLHTVAACYAAGAAGVVLDNQLALTQESQLPEIAKDSISRMDGSETLCLGEELGAPCRIFFRPRLRIIEKFRSIEENLLKDSKEKARVPETWRKKVQECVGWSDPEHSLWLLGQDAAFAAGLGHRFRTVGGILEGMRQAIDENVRTARSLKPLDKDSPLARSHGTKYPIVQGPMTRVSDRASFAVKVAEAGGLPFLALALMRAHVLKSATSDGELEF
jgi:NAD(P)H-dependent flavin oxidoreductase YrpB (nitropropane dioxygenase family)